nr:hypothetical protein [Tanacetum cinerariifolium]
MSAKRTAWNEFSSSMASAIICLATDSSSKFYMYPRFLQLIIRAQVGDLSSHTTKYSSLVLTQKVFANMRRIRKGFSGVETPLFEGMIVAQQADDVADEGVADVDRSCLWHHLQSPTLLSTPILNWGEYFEEPTRSYQTEPHDLDFMPEPIYPEYIPLEDEHILPAEEQPLPPIVSPTAESPEYVAESDPEEDPKEYEDDETEDGPVDYPMDGGDDGDDDDGDSSGDDADDEDEDEEEEHLPPADSAVVIPTDELAAISFPPEAEVERLLAMPTPSPLLLASLSPPFAGERLARCTTPTALPSPPLPPPLHMPPPVDRRDDIPETEMPPRKRDTWIDPTETVPEITPMTVGETEIAELRETDCRHQAQMPETLRVMGDIRREMGDMQAELLALREKPRRAGQPGGC